MIKKNTKIESTKQETVKTANLFFEKQELIKKKRLIRFTVYRKQFRLN